ncbi:MAG: replication protein RepA [Sediminibacterium sp.]
MSEHDDKKKPLKLSNVAKRRTKIVYEAHMEDADDREMLFQAAAMCQVFLPRREPLTPNEIWETESGKFNMTVIPLPVLNPQTHKNEYLGLPYGTKARIILAKLNTLAVQSQSRIIDVSSANLTQFVTSLNLSEGGNQFAAVREQIARLSNCIMRVTFDGEDYTTNANMPIVSRFNVFKDQNNPQRWPEQIELSELYFNTLISHAVPISELHLAALSNNATAIDLYCFLAHRLHRIQKGKPIFLTWKTVKDQFGREYSRLADFRANFIKVISLVKSLYTDARIELKGNKGIVLHNSPTPIVKQFALL